MFFENYLDDLQMKLSRMILAEIEGEYIKFKKDPERGYESYLKSVNNKVFMLIEEEEKYNSFLWEDFSETDIKELYEAMLLRQRLLSASSI